MAEEIKDEVQKDTKKTDSRKFCVWLTWLIISIMDIVLDAAVIIVTKSITDNLITLTEKILGWFFAISMMYIGMNVTQKIAPTIASTIADAVGRKEEELR